MTQGQGEKTVRKEAALLGHMRMNFTVHRKYQSKQGYHLFDINAGCGYNHVAKCNGSPLVSLEAARQMEVGNVTFHFVDKDRSMCEELLTRVGDDLRCTVYNGDNREFVNAIPDLIRRQPGEDPLRALGSVFCDPNGTDLPIDELHYLSYLCTRLDFILNYPARTWKRERAAGFGSANLFLWEILDKLNKKVWWIQCPDESDPNEWMLLVGRNFGMNDWPSMGIYLLDSPEGQDCLRRSLTRRESTTELQF
jgi:three-Cys-motif partner protein